MTGLLFLLTLMFSTCSRPVFVALLLFPVDV